MSNSILRNICLLLLSVIGYFVPVQAQEDFDILVNGQKEYFVCVPVGQDLHFDVSSSKKWHISGYPISSIRIINQDEYGLDVHVKDLGEINYPDFRIKFNNGFNFVYANIKRRPNINTKYICVESARIYWGKMVTIEAKIWFNKCGGTNYYVDAPFSNTVKYYSCQPGYSQYMNPHDGLAYAKSDTFRINSDEEKAYLVTMSIPRAAIMTTDQEAKAYWLRFNIFVMNADDPNYMSRVKYTLTFKNKFGYHGEINNRSGVAEPVVSNKILKDQIDRYSANMVSKYEHKVKDLDSLILNYGDLKDKSLKQSKLSEIQDQFRQAYNMGKEIQSYLSSKGYENKYVNEVQKNLEKNCKKFNIRLKPKKNLFQTLQSFGLID